MKTDGTREKTAVTSGKPAKKSKLITEIYEWLDSLTVAFITVVLLMTFIFRVVSVDGASMMDTLKDEDKVILTQLFYTPKQGDIVVLLTDRNFAAEMSDVNRPLIKRVIAVEDQHVDIDFDSGVVYVDGVALTEPYAKEPVRVRGTLSFPQIVPKGHVFVLGDNRNNSLDSRFQEVGMVDNRYVLGHAMFRVFPLDSIGGLD
ncbi:MAG TPA: signal peptidase I [Ruminococcaceae bacterium]|nr:signal peptidase I [Oscillospiraceae bacterium]